MPACHRLFVTIFAALVLVACRSESPATPTAEPPLPTATPLLRSFPTQAPIDARGMALLIGRLTTVDGCLWVTGEHGWEYPITWPYGYGWSVDGGVVQLRDETGRVVAQVDDVISMAGGEGPTGSLSDPCLTTEKVWYAVGPVEVVNAGTPSP